MGTSTSRRTRLWSSKAARAIAGKPRGRNDRTPGSVLTLYRKQVRGSLFGDCNPTTDIPRILGLYQAGDIKLDEIITRTYRLDEVNEGYDDLLAGKNVRGVVVHEHA